MLTELINAFRAGAELANAEVWKKRQVLVNALVAFLSAALAVAAAAGYTINLDDDGVRAIAGALAALVGLFNAGATVATTTRIGLPSRRDAVGADGADRVGDGADQGRHRAGDGAAGGDAGPDDPVPVLNDGAANDAFTNRSAG